MAERLAARLAAQEEQIRLLSQEIYSLRDALLLDPEVGQESPLLDSLRADNERLRYRLVHLRRGLQAEPERRGRAAPGGKKMKASKTVASKSEAGSNNKVPTEASDPVTGVLHQYRHRLGNDTRALEIAVSSPNTGGGPVHVGAVAGGAIRILDVCSGGGPKEPNSRQEEGEEAAGEGARHRGEPTRYKPRELTRFSPANGPN